MYRQHSCLLCMRDHHRTAQIMGMRRLLYNPGQRPLRRLRPHNYRWSCRDRRRCMLAGQRWQGIYIRRLGHIGRECTHCYRRRERLGLQYIPLLRIGHWRYMRCCHRSRRRWVTIRRDLRCLRRLGIHLRVKSHPLLCSRHPQRSRTTSYGCMCQRYRDRQYMTAHHHIRCR